MLRLAVSPSLQICSCPNKPLELCLSLSAYRRESWRLAWRIETFNLTAALWHPLLFYPTPQACIHYGLLRLKTPVLLLVDCLNLGHPVLSKLDPPHPWESLSVLGTLGPALGRQRATGEEGHETFLAHPPCRVPPPLLARLLFLCPHFGTRAIPPIISPCGRPIWGPRDARRSFVFEIFQAPGCWEGSKFLQLAPLPRDVL